MGSTGEDRSGGSRTAGYVLAALVATIPAWMFLGGFLGIGGATAAVVVAWATLIVWLLKRRQEDPGWDRRLPAPHTRGGRHG